MRAIEKKLRQIKLLKEKQDGGTTLNEQELQKLGQEPTLTAQLDLLLSKQKKS